MKKLIFSAFFLILVVVFGAYRLYAQTSGRVFWRGTVDDKVQLVIRNDTITENTISGQANPDGIYSFTTPLPASAVNVAVSKKKGRGNARVLQQPTSDNDFTAIIEIYDNGGGAREYQLEISWN
jgi:hypothetical protein